MIVLAAMVLTLPAPRPRPGPDFGADPPMPGALRVLFTPSTMATLR